MATITIEAVPDTASGRTYAEIYVGDETTPRLRSEPAFASRDDLVRQVLDMCRHHFPDHFPFVDDPTIGV